MMDTALLLKGLVGVAFAVGLAAGPSIAAPDLSPPGSLTLWYEQPAQNVLSAGLPIGNGRMGGMVLGGAALDRLPFNENSLWTGDDNPSGNYDTMGGYQAFGDVRLTLPGHESATGYRRQLDLSDALARVAYQAGGVTYTREYLASHPDQVIVIRLTADRPGGYTGTVALTDMHNARITVTGGTVTSAGALLNGERYEAQLRVLHAGGSVRAEGGKLAFARCDSLTLLLACGTDYVMDGARGWRGVDPHDRVTRQIEAASAKPYAALKSAHAKDYRALFERVALDLGRSPADGPAQGQRQWGRRPRTGGPAVPVRAVSADRLLAPRRAARQSSGTVERQQRRALAQRLPRQHQRPGK